MEKESRNSTESLEVYGNTVEEAVQKALKELKVSREEVEVKVVSEEKKGLFGMGGQKPAKIIATVKQEE